MKCDICESEVNVVAGRWIFYCPDHKHIDRQKTLDNETTPSLESGDIGYMLDNADDFADILI